MKVRISGTQEECAAAVTGLRAGFEVREVSEFYPNRGGSALGRVYVDAVPVDPATTADRRIRATATTVDPERVAVDRAGRELPGGAS